MARPGAIRSGGGISSLWKSDIWPTLALGSPIAGAQLAQMAINTTDVVMVGWLGAEPLAAMVLAFNLYIVIWLFGMGVLQAVIPLGAKARGERNPRELRRAVRMGLWVVAFYSVPALFVLWHTQAILLALGQEAEVARLAGLYMQVLMFALPPSLATMAIRNFITVMEKAQVVLWATVSAALVNALFDYVLIFGHFGAPKLGIVGAGVASVATALSTTVLLVVYCLRERKLRRYAIFGRIWRTDWPYFFEILKLGWPIGLTILFEVGLFAGSTIPMGWLGTVPLAAHGIALQIASITFMVPLGIGQAGMIRVGLAAGHKDTAAVGRAGWSATAVALAFMGLMAVVMWTFPHELVSLFLDGAKAQSGEVIAIGASFLAVAALFQLFDAAQVVGSSVLRGLSDTRVPMVIAAAGYWGVGGGLAFLLAFPLGLDGLGIWWGLAMGLAFVAVAALYRFHRRDRYGLVAGAAPVTALSGAAG
ncbi:MATE family efflux transporter [Stappia sp. GBMRC 2046]|uniref:Multidrug-efflux transporter n=1 Tax=Stappia sediminis TaxID=2692190 RepID=A0A7X3LUG4_9HYPH|nr:MATE family efflux transporter [Stappia sediminis]MXN65345.1 MATE family efflux transporter [Stappia sediminis]